MRSFTNPMPTIDLPARSYTEVEFSVRATTAAAYLAGYEFRITDDGIRFLGRRSRARRGLCPSIQRGKSCATGKAGAKEHGRSPTTRKVHGAGVRQYTNAIRQRKARSSGRPPADA